mmetsp:Transcript_23801/g.54019  ORF Transcript_23801/g.54019 Transcript_23801/m.54019 type:complete len:204 (-) Transcript_23801:572-1183(-)
MEGQIAGARESPGHDGCGERLAELLDTLLLTCGQGLSAGAGLDRVRVGPVAKLKPARAAGYTARRPIGEFLRRTLTLRLDKILLDSGQGLVCGRTAIFGVRFDIDLLPFAHISRCLLLAVVNLVDLLSQHPVQSQRHLIRAVVVTHIATAGPDTLVRDLQILVQYYVARMRVRRREEKVSDVVINVCDRQGLTRRLDAAVEAH